MNIHFSQPTIEIAFIIGWVTLASSLFVLLGILFLRASRFRRDASEKEFLAIWRPLLLDPASSAGNFPSIRRKHTLAFLKLWNYYQESVKGEERQRLMELARALKMDQIALKWLRSFSNRKKLMAILSLGYLKEEKAWDKLVALMKAKSNLVSLTAARALVHIHPAQAIPLIVPMALFRKDWPPLLSDRLFKEAGPEANTHPLSEAIFKTPPAQLVRLIDFLNYAYYEKCIVGVRELLKIQADPEVICACLRFLKDPRDANFVRPYLTHPFWPVRMNAVKTLGSIGSKEDVPLFLSLLSDPEWWVRYWSAKALVNFTQISSEELENLKSEASALGQEMMALVSLEEALA